MVFDGTDLSLAYGTSDGLYDQNQNQNGSYSQQQSNSYDEPSVNYKQQQQQQQQQQQHQQQQPQLAQQVALPPQGMVDPSYAPPQAMYQQQGKVYKHNSGSGVGFFERMVGKKGEILKLVVLSLVILLAISIDKVATFYYNNYISTAYLTGSQEILVRISYPLLVILLLWVIKAM